MLSVIVVNYNAGILLEKCVNSLLASQLEMPFEIVVVDNASHDNSLAAIEALHRWRQPIKIIRNNINAGFPRACNIGIENSAGDYYLFMNPDAYVEKNTLAIVLAALQADPQAGMATACVVNPDGTEQRGCRRNFPDLKTAVSDILGLYKIFPKWFPNFNQTNTAMPMTTVAIPAISGSFMMIKKSALEKVGLWDEAYYLHNEDLDLCKRFGQAGYKILWIPNARVTHEQGSCSRKNPIRVEWYKHKGFWRFYRKFQAQDHTIFMHVTLFIGIWVHFGYKMLRAML